MPEPRSVYGVVAAVVVSAALLFSTFVLARSIGRARDFDHSIHVTGSARRIVRSDFVIWDGRIAVQKASMGDAYTSLHSDISKFKAYLLAQHVPTVEIFPSAIETTVLYATPTGKPPSGVDPSSLYRKIAGYQLSQELEVRSTNVHLVEAVSRSSSDLMKNGISVESEPAQYLITNLNDLKGTILAEAAENARSRAEQIAKSSGARLGDLQEAHMGVMSVTAAYSNATEDDSGAEDTSSLDKKVTVIVTSSFAVR